MLIEVRRAIAEDISRVLKFYAERRYGGGIRPEDAVLLAEHDGELAGIGRLTTEEGVVVLRGMQVHPRFQRPGKREKTPGGCGPRAGWQRLLLHPVCASRQFLWRNRIPRDGTAKAPTFLRLRLEKYRDCGDGNDYLIMRREGIQEASNSVRADTSLTS